MNTTVQLPSRATTTLITWVATISILAVLGAVAGLLAGRVGPATIPALVVGLPVAVKATLRHADALAAQARHQAAATR